MMQRQTQTDAMLVRLEAEQAPQSTTPHSVVLIDDQPEYIGFARYLLEKDASIQVVGEATSGEQAIPLVTKLQPQVAIVDVDLPNMNGFETVRRLRKTSPSTRIIMMSAADEPEYPHIALAAGAVGFASKRSLSSGSILCLLA